MVNARTPEFSEVYTPGHNVGQVDAQGWHVEGVPGQDMELLGRMADAGLWRPYRVAQALERLRPAGGPDDVDTRVIIGTYSPDTPAYMALLNDIGDHVFEGRPSIDGWLSYRPGHLVRADVCPNPGRVRAFMLRNSVGGSDSQCVWPVDAELPYVTLNSSGPQRWGRVILGMADAISERRTEAELDIMALYRQIEAARAPK
jgi:hypothetical protein